MPPEVRSGGSFSQTLSRGLCVLELLEGADGPLTAGTIAYQLDVHRSVVYRLIRTLVAHGLVEPLSDDRYGLGLGLVTLARGVETDFRTAVHPILASLAEDLGSTVILPVAEGKEMVCLVSVEPQVSGLLVTHREGLRQPMARGASGMALLSAHPPLRGERPGVRRARELGYAVSEAELEPGTRALSAPIRPPGHPCRAVVTVLSVASRVPDERKTAELVVAAAKRIGDIAARSHRIL